MSALLGRAATEAIAQFEQAVGPRLRREMRARPYSTLMAVFGAGFAAGRGLSGQVGQLALYLASRYAGARLVKKGALP